jgi:hypothetical protein
MSIVLNLLSFIKVPVYTIFVWYKVLMISLIHQFCEKSIKRLIMQRLLSFSFLTRCFKYVPSLLVLSFSMFYTACNQADTYYAPTAEEADASLAGTHDDVDLMNDYDMSGQAGINAGSTAGMIIDDETQRLAEQVAFIDVDLTPRKPLYTRNETAMLAIVAYDRYGNELPLPTLQVTPRPESIAQLNDTELTFLEEGQGALRLCVDLNRSVCGRVSFYVDDAAPTITLQQPQPFAIQRGEQATLEVKGIVQGHQALYINEVEVTTNTDGTFIHTIPLHFGYNTVEVSASDGIRTPATRILRSVLYAPQELAMDSERLQWENGIILNIAPSVLYDAQGVADTYMDQFTRFGDLSNTLSYILSYLNPLALLDEALVEDDNFQLFLIDIDMGTPHIQIIPQDDRLEIFLRFANFRAIVDGSFSFEGIEIDLSGAISIDMSAFTALRVVLQDGSFSFEIDEVGIALEDLSASMIDPTAQALIDTLTSTLRLGISAWGETFIQQLAREEVPRLINQQSLEVVDLFEALEFSFTQEDLQVDARTRIEPSLSQLQVSAAQGLSAYFDVIIDRQSDPNANVPAYQEAIIPSHAPHEIPWRYDRKISIALALSTLNALLYDLWQQELLSINLSDKIPSFLTPLIGRAELSSVLPPLITETATGSAAALALSIEGLYLDIWSADMSRQDRYRVSLYAALGLETQKPDLLAVSNGMDITGLLQFTLPQGAILRVSLEEQGGDLAVVDPNLIETSITQLLVPTIDELVQESLHIDYPIIQLDVASQESSDSQILLNQDLWLIPNFEEGLSLENGWLMLNASLDSVFIPKNQ